MPSISIRLPSRARCEHDVPALAPRHSWSSCCARSPRVVFGVAAGGTNAAMVSGGGGGAWVGLVEPLVVVGQLEPRVQRHTSQCPGRARAFSPRQCRQLIAILCSIAPEDLLRVLRRIQGFFSSCVISPNVLEGVFDFGRQQYPCWNRFRPRPLQVHLDPTVPLAGAGGLLQARVGSGSRATSVKANPEASTESSAVGRMPLL